MKGRLWEGDRSRRGRVKPIFHCNAKPLALGLRVGLDPQRDNFKLGIPTCWYLKSLADPTRPPNANQQCPMPSNSALQEPKMPNASSNVSRWNIGRVGFPVVRARIGLVDFMLFVSLSLALGSQQERNFRLNMGFRVWILMVVMGGGKWLNVPRDWQVTGRGRQSLTDYT